MFSRHNSSIKNKQNKHIIIGSKTSTRQVSNVTPANYQRKIKQIELSLSTVQNWLNNNQAVLNINQQNLNNSSFKITDNSICKLKEIIYKKLDKSISGEFHTGYIVRINELSPLQIISNLNDNNFTEDDKKYLPSKLLNSNDDLLCGKDPKNIANIIYNDNINKIFIDKEKYIYIAGKCKPCSTHLFENPKYSGYPDTIDFIKLDTSYLHDKCSDIEYVINPSIYKPNISRLPNYKSDILFIDNEGNIDIRYQKFVIHNKIILNIDGNDREFIIIGHPNMFEMSEILHNHIYNADKINKIYEFIKSNNKKELIDAYNSISNKDKWKLYNEIISDKISDKIINNDKEIFKISMMEIIHTELPYIYLLYKLMNRGNINKAKEDLKKLLTYIGEKYNQNTINNINFPCENIKYQFQVFIKNIEKNRYQPAFLTQYDILPIHMPILDKIDEMITNEITPLFGITKTERFIKFVRLGDIFTVNAVYLGTNDNIYEYNYIYSSMIQYSVFKHYIRHNLYLSGNEIPAYRYRNYKFVKFSDIQKLDELGELYQPEKTRAEIRKDFNSIIKTPNISIDNILDNIVSINDGKNSKVVNKVVNQNELSSSKLNRTQNRISTNRKNSKKSSILIRKISTRNNLTRKNNNLVLKSNEYKSGNVYLLSFVKLQSEQYEFTIRYTINGTNKYYYGTLKKAFMNFDLINRNINDRISFLKNDNFDINLIKLGDYMKNYQPYLLEYLEEITPNNADKLGIPYYDFDGILSTIGLITVSDPIYTNRPYISLRMSKKPDDENLDNNESELLKLKFMSRTIVDMYLFLKRRPLNTDRSIKIYANTDKLFNYVSKGSNDKLIALSTSNIDTPMLNKLGPEISQIANEYLINKMETDIAKAVKLNKNCIWFFDKRFIDIMDCMIKGKYNEQDNLLINLYENDYYKYFLNDYSALTTEHYSDLKEIVNELCINLYGYKYDGMKDKLCIKFHNFNACVYKVLHMHMGPESNYYNYEKFNRHNIVREFKNLLSSHTLFCLKEPTFAFDNGKDNMYNSKFGDYYLCF